MPCYLTVLRTDKLRSPCFYMITRAAVSRKNQKNSQDEVLIRMAGVLCRINNDIPCYFQRPLNAVPPYQKLSESFQDAGLTGHSPL